MVTASTSVPGRQPSWSAGGIRRINEGDDQSNQYRILGIDFNFVDFYDLSILEGRNFSEDFGQNSTTVLYNESAIQLMGFEDYASAMNVPIFFWGDTFNIVGVVKDYHIDNLLKSPNFWDRRVAVVSTVASMRRRIAATRGCSAGTSLRVS